jgi:hypothetical protein
MPRYCFHLILNDQKQIDEKGTDLPDDDAAREEAIESALRHINQRVKEGWVQNGRDVLEGSLEVAKEGGTDVAPRGGALHERHDPAA